MLQIFFFFVKELIELAGVFVDSQSTEKDLILGSSKLKLLLRASLLILPT